MSNPVQLFNAHLDGKELTEDEAHLLSAWVVADDENAKLIVKLSMLHECLDSRMCLSRMLDDLPLEIDPQIRAEIAHSLDDLLEQVEASGRPIVPAAQQNILWKPIAIGSLAAAALLLITVIFFANKRPEEELQANNSESPVVEQPLVHVEPKNEQRESKVELTPEPLAERPAQLVASIEESLNVVWSKAEKAAQGGAILQGESIQLTEGILQLKSAVGHTLVVEAPANLTFVSPQRLLINSGKVVGQVGKHGGSLEFETPSALVVDLGTEFGVSVFDNPETMVADTETIIAVYDGAVELRGIQANLLKQSNQELTAGFLSTVNAQGQIANEPIELVHDRQFIRPDEVELRVKSKRGDTRAEATATYYELLRTTDLLAYQGFDRPSKGQENTIGFVEQPLRSTSRIAVTSDLNGSTNNPNGGAIVIADESPVFFDLDTSGNSPLARAGLLNARQRVGQSGTKIWLSWLARSTEANPSHKGFAGLSLTYLEDDLHNTFLGRLHSAGSLGVQLNKGDKIQRSKHPLDSNPNATGVQKIDADGKTHLWVARIQFTNQGDQLTVWQDIQPDKTLQQKPHLQLDGLDIEFDRIRLAIAIGDGVKPWLFDEVMLATSAEGLAEAMKIIQTPMTKSK